MKNQLDLRLVEEYWSGSFSHVLKKSESIMNQENAPHMQPMEQAGEQGAAPYPPYNEGQPATEAAIPNTQPAQTPIPPYGYGQGQFPPYPAQGAQAQPYPGMPYGMPYGGYPQLGYAVPAGNQPFATQMANVNGQAPHEQSSSANIASNLEQQLGAQGAPSYPVGYQQPQAGYPQQAFQQFAAAANPHVMQPATTQLHPQTVQQPASDAYQSEQPFVPSFVEQATYDEDYAHTMNGGIIESAEEAAPSQSFDYHHITTPARIAIYDSLKTAPRVIQVQGGPTHEYIEHIASLTYKNAKEAGGMIPYTVIREVSENFIHANFNEVVVSIFDQGNTIRFADQGPGIKNKDLVQEPGFSSAIEPMKRYIRGVGSGLPIVKDYLSTSHGHIEIKDNVNQGSVVTISLVASRTTDEEIEAAQIPDLTENEVAVLKALLPNNTLGVSEVSKATDIAVASVHTAFSKMEEAGLVEKVNKKRTLTPRGTQVALSL